MSGFAALMKLSQTQTAESELAVQSQIASHQVQLEKKRREQEVKERKERELEAKLRMKRFEEQRKEEERKRKREEERITQEKELAKREEQMRDALKYGPRKASSAASGSSSKSKGTDKGGDGVGGPSLTREELRARQNEPSDGGSVLTREEKRERKLAAELRRTATSPARKSGGGRVTSLPDGRTVRRLPGGAVDYTTVSRLAEPDAATPALPGPDLSGKSARERLAAMPSTLMKLNTVKRDTRTIDEILIDRAKAKQAKVLAGDAAKEFSDWFGKNKKKAAPPQQQPTSTTPSRATTPSVSPAPTVNPFAGAATVKAKPASSAIPSKSSSPFLRSINPKLNALASAISRPPSSASCTPTWTKKRPRSPSNSDTPPPPAAKRRQPVAPRPAPVAASTRAPTSRPSAASRPSASSHVDIATEIWSIFGKDKKSYTARDVLSDDEDMEADARSVLKEEARSARLAHKEDESALAEERRHEEEKRRRKRERERRERA